ncbi:MAG: serine/threonine protein kinase [Candidatus Melainabacteria bacterium]|nr:serine/threonine protein kinase [Candidatus Melainabacteria bacterium]
MEKNAPGSSKLKLCTACDGIFENPDFFICPRDGNKLIEAGRVDRLIGVMLNERYRVVEQLHRGGRTTIYRGRHELMGRDVAIKVLNPEWVCDQISIKRFQQEAQAVSHLQHPGVVTVYDYGFVPSGQPFMVMDLLQGETLHTKVVQEGPLSSARFRKLFWEICGAMAQAHDLGVVHRDLKPANILLTRIYETEVPIIIDFSIARLMPSSKKTNQSLTQTGEILGTPLYMSPEQCLAASIDARSDIYSLGCTMFFALTGEPPFRGDSNIDTMELHMMGRVETGRLPADLEPVVLKAMAKNHRDRYASMDQLGEALTGKPVDKRNWHERGLHLAGVGEKSKDQNEPPKKKKRFWFF